MRFWQKVLRLSPEDCWPWTAATSGFGYGRFKMAGRLYSSHRVAYALANGRIEDDASYHGSVVMHSCDNPRCCNPLHLKLGTQKQNARDMSNKGRSVAGRLRPPRPERAVLRLTS